MRGALLVAAFVLALGGAAGAADAIRFGPLTYGGTGCPRGTGHVVMAPDRQSASLVLDAYRVSAGAGGFARQACALAIPVTVPAGRAVAIRALALRGEATLPAGASATLSVEPFFAGGAGTPQTRTLAGPLAGAVTQHVTLADDRLVWSACGAAVTLRLNTSLRLRPPPGGSGGTVTLRAINLYRLATKAC